MNWKLCIRSWKRAFLSSDSVSNAREERMALRREQEQLQSRIPEFDAACAGLAGSAKQSQPVEASSAVKSLPPAGRHRISATVAGA